MQRAIPLLAAALVLQIGAAVALDLRGDGLAARRPSAALIAADLQAADHLLIDGPRQPDAAAGAKAAAPGSVEIARRDGHWLLPGAFDAPADGDKVKTLLDRLAAARRGLAVATSADAKQRFAVADGHYERRLVARQGDKALATLYLGSSPGLRQSDARVAPDDAVYAIGLATYDLPTRPKDWLDTGLLTADAAQLQRIEVTLPGQPALTLQPAAARPAAAASAAAGASRWQASGLPAGRQLDAVQADALAQALSTLHVETVLGTTARPEWQQDHPALQLVLTGADGKPVTWVLSQSQGADKQQVLKASNHPWYLGLPAWSAQSLEATAGKLLKATTTATTTATGPAPAAAVHALAATPQKKAR